MELKRATELSICALLSEALPDLAFYSSKGGGDDVTPVWAPNTHYAVGDTLRPTNLTLTRAIAVTFAGNSGATEPAFNDVPGSVFTGPPNYLTTDILAVTKAEDSGSPLPPFAAVICDPSEKMISYEDTDMMHGMIIWVTKFDETNVVVHSDDFKRIYNAVQKIGSGYDVLRRLVVHGVDISSTSEFHDTERQAHGDVLEFVVGVTAKF